MQLSGVRTHIILAGSEIIRCPRCRIESTRHVPLTQAVLSLPDPTGELFRTLNEGDPVEIRLGYRDQVPASWKGTIRKPSRGKTGDQIEVRAVGKELPLSQTMICQSWENETPEAIVTWAIRQCGLPVGRIDSLGMVLPKFIASTIPVWQVAMQVAMTCQRAFDVDMSRWALWLGKNGVNWGAFDEPGEVPVIATAAGLIKHSPDSWPAGWSAVETFLLPGLMHSRRFRLQDARRGIDVTERVQRVIHEIEPNKVRTHLHYGVEHGTGK